MVNPRAAYSVGRSSSICRHSDYRITPSSDFDLRCWGYLDFLKLKGSRWAAVLCFMCFCGVLAWWLNLKPSNVGDWQPDVDRAAWADVDGDRVTIHNLRNCDYRTETDYANCWSARTLYLSRIQAAELFLTNWGLRWASHPIISFDFGDNEHVAFSIEARYKAGQSYSPILGCFRQYGLIVVTSDERDVIRLRTNYRKMKKFTCTAFSYNRKQHGLCSSPMSPT